MNRSPLNRSPLRFIVAALLVVVVVVLGATNVLPNIGSSNYWWVVLALAVIGVGIRLYWRSTTGSWKIPHNRHGSR